VEHGADIINLSFDLGIGSHDLEEAVGEACAAGALIVFAAGNTGSNNDAYPLVPARYAALCRERTVVAMATDWYDDRPTFSNFGPKTVDLAAPGVRVLSTRARWADGRRYARYTGTSAAAAHVSGALALLKTRLPHLNAKDLKSRLLQDAEGVQAMRLPRPKCSSGARLRLA
jgi:subtilisin family serine protease